MQLTFRSWLPLRSGVKEPGRKNKDIPSSVTAQCRVFQRIPFGGVGFPSRALCGETGDPAPRPGPGETTFSLH